MPDVKSGNNPRPGAHPLVRVKSIKHKLPGILLLFSFVAWAEPQSYIIHPSKDNRMELRVLKTGFMRGKQHLFVFERYRGSVVHDAAKPEKSSVTLAIESSSIVCKDTWVSEKDLRKIQTHALEEMLEAEKHPEIRFQSSSVKQVEPGKFEAQGMLTIRGVAKPQTVSVRLSPAAGDSLLLQGEAEIDMKEFGLKPPSAAFGTIGTKSEMPFSFTLTVTPGG
jgi:polyisoprenoid-binding protein YceI